MKNTTIKISSIGTSLLISILTSAIVYASDASAAANMNPAAATTRPAGSTEGTFTIHPSFMHGDNKAWIIQQTSPEQTINDFVTLENLSGQKENISLIVREAKNVDANFIPIDDPNMQNIGLWTSIPQTSYTVGAHEKVKIPISINIPKGVPSKEYTGVIFAVKEEQGNQNIKTITRIGVRMYIKVSSPSFFQNNFFSSYSYKNSLFFILSLFGLIAAIFYNLINFIENKKYAKNHS